MMYDSLIGKTVKIISGISSETVTTVLSELVRNSGHGLHIVGLTLHGIEDICYTLNDIEIMNIPKRTITGAGMRDKQEEELHQMALVGWKNYQETGIHATGEEVSGWLRAVASQATGSLTPIVQNSVLNLPSGIDRVVIIESQTGRVYDKQFEGYAIQAQLQDDNKTLKLFCYKE